MDMTTDLLHLFDDIVRLEIELWNAVETRLRDEHGVPLAWFETMNVIGGTGDTTVNDLTQRLTITVGGASKLVDRIESAGFVRRTAHPTDGRSSIIELTPSGKRLLEKLRLTVSAELGDLIGKRVPKKTQQQLARNIRTLREAIRGEQTAKHSLNSQ
jgi:DNA-binding MarR family transcriptional regulator